MNNIMVTARSKTLSKTDLLTWRNAAIEHAFQCGITVGHLGHIFDLTERQIYSLKKWEGQVLALIPKQGKPQSEARVRAQRKFLCVDSAFTGPPKPRGTATWTRHATYGAHFSIHRTFCSRQQRKGKKERPGTWDMSLAPMGSVSRLGCSLVSLSIHLSGHLICQSAQAVGWWVWHSIVLPYGPGDFPDFGILKR